jgi:PAS domain S-box-containing protein
MLEAELFAFLERTADATFAVTREGQICSWNQAAERLFGYSSADVLNRACY